MPEVFAVTFGAYALHGQSRSSRAEQSIAALMHAESLARLQLILPAVHEVVTEAT